MADGSGGTGGAGGAALRDRLRSGDVRLLVCSDVAARGIDIHDLSHVFNFDIPRNADDYVHRIGRTGRAGMTGEAVTIVTPEDKKALAKVVELIGAEPATLDVDGAPSDAVDAGAETDAPSSAPEAAPEASGEKKTARGGRSRGRRRREQRVDRRHLRRPRGTEPRVRPLEPGRVYDIVIPMRHVAQRVAPRSRARGSWR